MMTLLVADFLLRSLFCQSRTCAQILSLIVEGCEDSPTLFPRLCFWFFWRVSWYVLWADLLIGIEIVLVTVLR